MGGPFDSRMPDGAPNVASVLFGATSPEQLRQNAAGLDAAARLDDEQWAQLLAVGRETP